MTIPVSETFAPQYTAPKIHYGAGIDPGFHTTFGPCTAFRQITLSLSVCGCAVLHASIVSGKWHTNSQRPRCRIDSVHDSANFVDVRSSSWAVISPSIFTLSLLHAQNQLVSCNSCSNCRILAVYDSARISCSSRFFFFFKFSLWFFCGHFSYIRFRERAKAWLESRDLFLNLGAMSYLRNRRS